jgi:uncharacterized SAM-binding protein YcdF (DUF218 family)
MSFVLSKLLWGLAAPGNLLLLLLLAGLLASRRRRAGGRLVAAAALVLLAIAVLPVGQWMIAPLEARFPPPALLARVDGIIVLGGAVETGITKAHAQVGLDDAAERLTEATVLARRYPQATLLVTGGSGSLFPQGDSEGEVMRRFFVEQGIPPDRILIEGRSRNTFENALLSRDLAHPQPGQVWLLVTSAAHMPRAVGCFRHVGWSVLAYPVDYRTGGETLLDFALAEHLHLVDLAAKEWVGLLAYRAAGRIDSVFPAPDPTSPAG